MDTAVIYPGNDSGVSDHQWTTALIVLLSLAVGTSLVTLLYLAACGARAAIAGRSRCTNYCSRCCYPPSSRAEDEVGDCAEKGSISAGEAEANDAAIAASTTPSLDQDSAQRAIPTGPSSPQSDPRGLRPRDRPQSPGNEERTWPEVRGSREEDPNPRDGSSVIVSAQVYQFNDPEGGRVNAQREVRGNKPGAKTVYNVINESEEYDEAPANTGSYSTGWPLGPVVSPQVEPHLTYALAENQTPLSRAASQPLVRQAVRDSLRKASIIHGTAHRFLVMATRCLSNARLAAKGRRRMPSSMMYEALLNVRSAQIALLAAELMLKDPQAETLMEDKLLEISNMTSGALWESVAKLDTLVNPDLSSFSAEGDSSTSTGKFLSHLRSSGDLDIIPVGSPLTSYVEKYASTGKLKNKSSSKLSSASRKTSTSSAMEEFRTTLSAFITNESHHNKDSSKKSEEMTYDTVSNLGNSRSSTSSTSTSTKRSRSGSSSFFGWSKPEGNSDASHRMSRATLSSAVSKSDLSDSSTFSTKLMDTYIEAALKHTRQCSRSSTSNSQSSSHHGSSVSSGHAELSTLPVPAVVKADLEHQSLKKGLYCSGSACGETVWQGNKSLGQDFLGVLSSEKHKSQNSPERAQREKGVCSQLGTDGTHSALVCGQQDTLEAKCTVEEVNEVVQPQPKGTKRHSLSNKSFRPYMTTVKPFKFNMKTTDGRPQTEQLLANSSEQCLTTSSNPSEICIPSICLETQPLQSTAVMAQLSKSEADYSVSVPIQSSKFFSNSSWISQSIFHMSLEKAQKEHLQQSKLTHKSLDNPLFPKKSIDAHCKNLQLSSLSPQSNSSVLFKLKGTSAPGLLTMKTSKTFQTERQNAGHILYTRSPIGAVAKARKFSFQSQSDGADDNIRAISSKTGFSDKIVASKPRSLKLASSCKEQSNKASYEINRLQNSLSACHTQESNKSTIGRREPLRRSSALERILQYEANESLRSQQHSFVEEPDGLQEPNISSPGVGSADSKADVDLPVKLCDYTDSVASSNSAAYQDVHTKPFEIFGDLKPAGADVKAALCDYSCQWSSQEHPLGSVYNNDSCNERSSNLAEFTVDDCPSMTVPATAEISSSACGLGVFVRHLPALRVSQNTSWDSVEKIVPVCKEEGDRSFTSSDLYYENKDEYVLALGMASEENHSAQSSTVPLAVDDKSSQQKRPGFKLSQTKYMEECETQIPPQPARVLSSPYFHTSSGLTTSEATESSVGPVLVTSMSDGSESAVASRSSTSTSSGPVFTKKYIPAKAPAKTGRVSRSAIPKYIALTKKKSTPSRQIHGNLALLERRSHSPGIESASKDRSRLGPKSHRLHYAEVNTESSLVRRPSCVPRNPETSSQLREAATKPPRPDVPPGNLRRATGRVRVVNQETHVSSVTSEAPLPPAHDDFSSGDVTLAGHPISFSSSISTLSFSSPATHSTPVSAPGRFQSSIKQAYRLASQHTDHTFLDDSGKDI